MKLSQYDDIDNFVCLNDVNIYHSDFVLQFTRTLQMEGNNNTK